MKSRLLVKFFVAAFMILTSPVLLFSQDSVQADLQAVPEIVLAGSEYGYPPYSITNSEGEADGFAVELLRESIHAMGYNVEFKVGSWEEVKEDLKMGRVDALPLAGKTPEREEFFDFTFPYLNMNGAIVVHEDTGSINTIEDLQDKVIAVMKGDNAEEYLLRYGIGSEIISTASFSEALKMVQEKRADAVLIQRLVALQIMKEEKIEDLQITGKPIMDFQQSFCFAVQKGNSQLLSVLNEGLSIVIANGTYDLLFSKWFGPLQLAGRSLDRIIVGGDSEYPPYEYLDENGEPAGFTVELTQAIAEELGLQVEIVLDQWSTTYEKLLNGEIDIVQGVFYSPERDKILTFTQPHSVLKHVMITREDEYMDLETMENLKGLKILVMAQDIMHQRAVEFGYEDMIITASTQEEALKLLSSGVADCALVAQMPALYWIDKNNLKNLTVRSQILNLNYSYAALDVSNSPEILMEFAEGLALLKAKGSYDAIRNKWLSVYEQTSPSFLDILRTFAFIFIPVAIIVLIIVLWTVILQRQVKERTKELREEITQKERAQKLVEASERQFRDYITYAPIGIFIADDMGRFLEANPAAVYTTGYAKEELLGRKLEDLLGEQEQKFFDRVYEHALKTGFISIIKEFKRKDSSISFWKIDAVMLSDSKMLGFITDITNLKSVEREISEDREKLRVTLRSIGDGVITTDIEGRVQLINKVAEKLTGWTQEEAAGRKLTEVFQIVNEQSGTSIINPVDKVLKTGSIIALENHTVLISKTGERFIVADSGAPIRDMKSEIIGVVLVFRDITHDEHIKEHLQKAVKLESLGVLAGGIAHDFNNLLSGIFGYLELAYDAASEGKDTIKYLDEVLPIFERTRSLTRQLLTFAKGGDPVKETGDIKKLLKDSVSFALSGSNVRPVFAIKDDLWLCNVDTQQIGQVVDNIVINAQQAMGDGGELYVSAENAPLYEVNELGLKAGDYVHIFIRDTGTGIPQEIIHKIFDPFFTTKQNGSGLGLSTCFSIITKHDGMLRVESEPGIGTTCHIYIPRVADRPVQVQDTYHLHHKGSGNIVILDDEPFIRNFMREMLESMGYEVTEAANGEAVLAYCRALSDTDRASDSGDIIAAFLDLTISGGLGGNDIIDELRSKRPDIPIFAMSGYSSGDIMAHPTSYGFTASIPKPFTKEELKEFLSTYLKKVEG